MAVKVNSEIGRTEYLLVGLVESIEQPTDRDGGLRTGYVAYPMGKGSGSVTTFSQADGFVTIGQHDEILSAGAEVRVQLLSESLRPAELVVIGSHCVGLDYLIGRLQAQGVRTRLMAVGSSAGLDAARRGECDVAGIHLFDAETGTYNRPFLDDRLMLEPGYGRRQGVVFRSSERPEGSSSRELFAGLCADRDRVMINRNQGSGTRQLIDRWLTELGPVDHPRGYAVQVNSHHAVAAAIAQRRADWGVAIETVVSLESGSTDDPLCFEPMEDERYDFVIPRCRRHRPAVESFCQLLADPNVQRHLESLGFSITTAVDQKS